MNWIMLNSDAQIETIKQKSQEKPQVIFKHSSRCGVSAWARNRLEHAEPAENVDFYFFGRDRQPCDLHEGCRNIQCTPRIATGARHPEWRMRLR